MHVLEHNAYKIPIYAARISSSSLLKFTFWAKKSEPPKTTYYAMAGHVKSQTHVCKMLSNFLKIANIINIRNNCCTKAEPNFMSQMQNKNKKKKRVLCVRIKYYDKKFFFI